MSDQDYRDSGALPSESVEHSIEHSSTETLPWGMPGNFAPLPRRPGVLRGDTPVLGVSSDVEAVAAWIAEKGSKSRHTATAYRREAERLLLWASETRGKSLSELMREDFLAFARFLEDPQPSDQWVMTGRHTRASPGWRPFIGPLSADSRRQSLRILYGLMRYLVDTGWLRANPMPAPQKRPGTQFDPQSKAIPPFLWEEVEKVLQALPRSSWADLIATERTRWLVGLIYDLGLRASEVCSATMADFTSLGDRRAWQLRLVRKGGKASRIPVPERTVERLTRFRRVLGLPPYPAPDESMAVAPTLKALSSPHDSRINHHGLTTNQLYRVIKDLFGKAADSIEVVNPEGARFLRQASTHSLRHTALKNLADHSGDLRLVQLLADHSDINTSAHYTRQDEHVLRRAMDGMEE